MICTHYDADHVNGILGLLDSNYSFTELWLPEIYGSLSRTVLENIVELREYYEERSDQLDFSDILSPPDYQTETADPQTEDSMERIDVDLLESISQNWFPWGDFFHRYNTKHRKLFFNLSKIQQLIVSSIRSGSYIKWFKYASQWTQQACGYGFVVQNAHRTSVTVYRPQLFFALLYLTTINRQSLVFRYDHNQTPSILFTADSDLAFVTDRIHLRKGSIVTAPHHGAGDNDSAYLKIAGEQLIYVRSDQSQARRPGEGYLRQKVRYCTICRNINRKKRVALSMHRSGTRFLEGNKCICQRKAT
jgi:hypothetical protein